MNKFYNETLHRLKTTVNELEVEADCSIQRIEAVILLIVECLSELKEYVLKTGFSDEDEEIRGYYGSISASHFGRIVPAITVQNVPF